MAREAKPESTRTYMVLVQVEPGTWREVGAVRATSKEQAITKTKPQAGLTYAAPSELSWRPVTAQLEEPRPPAIKFKPAQEPESEAPEWEELPAAPA